MIYSHKHEQDMIEQDRLIELLKKDIEVHNKVKRKFSVQLEKRQQELREFMVSYKEAVTILTLEVMLAIK